MSTPRDRIEAKVGLAGPPLSHLRDDPPRIPDHELIRRIGRGAYGEVWLARNALGTLRAVKIVYRDNFKDARPYEREFAGIRRFEPLSRSNEGFVDILQVGRDDAGGWFYYVMELADAAEPQVESSELRVEGEAKAPDQLSTLNLQPSTYTPRTLSRDLQQRGRLPLDQCLELGLTISFALGHLHRHGLIHRDIKPSNIIFVGGVPKLADIGLVTEAEGANTFVGTEGFIPPEGPTSPQADLYALGKVLYEAAMGKDRNEFPEPFTQIGTDRESVALMELNAVLLRACAPDSKARYASAEEMHADLALLQSGGSVRRQRRLTSQLRLVQRTGIVVTALAVLIALGWLWQARQTRKVRDLAAEKAELADVNARVANESRERIVRLDVANGVRLLDEGDTTGALLWFADALPLMTNSPAAAAVHRVRLQQAFSQTPRLLRVFWHESGVLSGAFSPDGRLLATGTDGSFRTWEAESGKSLINQTNFGRPVQDLRFTRDGKRLLLRSCVSEGHALEYYSPGFAAVIDAASGLEVYPSVTNIHPAAFSPDDRWLAVARTNLVIELLEASTGRHVAEFIGHTNDIFLLSFSSDGHLLASASRDRTVRIWRVPSGELAGPPIRHSQTMSRAVFSPDGRRLATSTTTGGGMAHFIRTWCVASGSEIGPPIQTAPIWDPLTFDAAGRRLITGDLPPRLNVWDADSHTVLTSLPQFKTVSVCWAFSPDGLRFALGSDGGMAFVWNLEANVSLTPSLHHPGSVESVQFSPDGTRLLTTCDDGTARLWDLATLPEAAKPLQLPSGVLRIEPDRFPHAVSSDGHRLVTAVDEPALRMVNLDTLTVEGEPLTWPDGEPPGQIQFDRSGRQWAVASGSSEAIGRSRSLTLWRQEGEKLRQLALPHPQAVGLFQFSTDGAQLFSAGQDGVFRTWHTSDGRLAAEARIPGGYKLPLAVSPDGSRAVFQREDLDVMLFDVANMLNAAVRLGSGDLIRMARFSPDGNRLALVGYDPIGHIWDARTGKVVMSFRHGPGVFWVEWSPDGQRVVTAGPGRVGLWDAATGALLFAPMEHRLAVRTALFSPDGRFLVTCCDDGTVRIWDAASAEAVTATLDQRTPKLRAAVLTTNNRLVTVSDPAVIRAWDLKEDRLPANVIADYARWLAGRKLDRAGVLRELSATELGELDTILRPSNPGLFTPPPGQIREWHRRQVQEPTSLARVKAGLFHLDQMDKLDPDDPWVREQQARFRACLIPPLGQATPTNLVDLSDFYTHSFGVLPRQDFASLPRGVQSLAGTPFDLRGMVRLEPCNSEFTIASFSVQAVSRIPVGRHCRELHFLQGVDGGEGRDGDEVARWVIHYADGTMREWPLIYGKQVRDWWLRPKSPKEASEAVIVWEGRSPIVIKAGVENVRLFKATWTNPLPGVEVRDLDFVLAKANVRPFVVAITAE